MNTDEQLLASRPEVGAPSPEVVARHRAMLEVEIEGASATSSGRRAATPGPMVAGVVAAPGVAERRRPLRSVLAAGAAVVLVVAGLAWSVRATGDGSERVQASAAASRSVDWVGSGAWAFPAALPDGWRVRYAYRDGSSEHTELVHHSGAIARIHVDPIDRSVVDTSVLDPESLSEDDGWVEVETDRSAVRRADDLLVAVVGPQPPVDDPARVAEVLAMRDLRPIDVAQLPVAIIDRVDGPYVDVATELFDGTPHTLSIAGPSGSYVASRLGEDPGGSGDRRRSQTSGCCLDLELDGTVGLIEAWSSVIVDDQSLLAGYVALDVSRIDFHLEDGSTISESPEARNHPFPVDFFLVTIPGVEGDPADTLGALESITTYDENGDRLERWDSF